jgi:hypothetical protein
MGRMPTGDAAKWRALLQRIETHREKWLSELPLEDRRRLERGN